MWHIVEAWAVNHLLSSPAFHKLVRGVHRGVLRIKHGKPVEEMGGTKVDRQDFVFLKHFKDEIKSQLKNLKSKR